MGVAVLTDAAFLLALRWVLAGLFAIAVIHKLMAPAAFVGTLQSYRLVPESLLVPAAWGVIGAELIAALALLANSRAGSFLALALLLLYSFAISINLVRGRRDIDCGCAGPYVRQTLSYWLVARNALFVTAALVTLGPSSGRGLGVLDWFTAIAAVATFLVIHFAANQIVFVSHRYGRLGKD